METLLITLLWAGIPGLILLFAVWAALRFQSWDDEVTHFWQEYED